MNKLKTKGYRGMLNRPGNHSTAAVVAEVTRLKTEITKYTPDPRPEAPEIEFVLSDCQRAVTLDFDTYTPEDRANSLYKADVLLEAVKAFHKAVYKEMAKHEEDLAAWKARQEPKDV